MMKNICNFEFFVLKKLVKTKIIIAISLSAMLVPLSAIAETNDPLQETYVEGVNDSSNKVTELNNDTIKPRNVGSSNSATLNNEALDVNSNVRSGENTQNRDTTTVSAATQELSDGANPINDNKAASTTAALDSVNKLDSANTEEKAVEQQPKTAKKTPFWQNTDYLLIGGLALLLLGGGLLLFRKISGLNAENQNLQHKHNMVTSNLAKTKKQLEQAKTKNAELEASLKQQFAIRNEINNSASGNFDAALPVIEELMVSPEIEELNSADLQQLSDSITTWFKTNRGNTEVRELVPDDIQHKLEHLSYKIELWVGSDGVDSIEPAQNTMRAAVISLTKPDRQGFAYCYKKPNSLSNVWVNKAWYKAQRTDRTLEVMGKSLEMN
jgi:hypothetical protein